MDESSVENHITNTFPGVETTTNFGYTFFFYQSERKFPFATIASSYNEYERISNLDRPGVYRLNIGVSKKTFQSLFGAAKVDVSGYDFTALDVIMPHPDYAQYHFICALSPSEATFERIRPLLAEAYDIAVRRFDSQNKSFLLGVSFIVAPLIYLMGNLRDAMGVFAYDLADFLYGPILSASLVTVIYALRERMGKQASRRMDLALLAAVLSAGGMAAVSFIRASNRHYHLMHPELHLENSSTVLIVWTTLVAGVSALGFYFLGWTFLLVGSAGWTSRLFPRLLSVFYLLAGISGLFVYLFPGLEGNVLLLGMIISIWQGILLWKAGPGETQAPEINASQTGRA